MGMGHTAAEILSRTMNVARGSSLIRKNARVTVRAALVVTPDVHETMISTFDGIRDHLKEARFFFSKRTLGHSILCYSNPYHIRSKILVRNKKGQNQVENPSRPCRSHLPPEQHV